MSNFGNRGVGGKAKRGLFTSPWSGKKDNKKARVSGRGGRGGEEERETQGEQGEHMEAMSSGNDSRRQEDNLLDIGTIHETVMTRINEALTGYGNKEGFPDNPLIKQLIPALATAVSVAVGEVLKTITRQLDERFDPPRPSVTEMKLQRTATLLTYENDRLEQYSRRESVRVLGIKSDQDETPQSLEGKVLKVFADAGADVTASDISTLHRTGKHRAGGSRPVLVRFVSRKKRREVMEKKKALKEKEAHRGVFINDDLTPLRARLLGLVKRMDKVDRAWTTEGRILCTLKQPVGTPGQGQKPVVIENPDDLFDKLGVESVDFEALGLPHLVEFD